MKETNLPVELLNHGVVGVLVGYKKGASDFTAVGVLYKKKYNKAMCFRQH